MTHNNVIDKDWIELYNSLEYHLGTIKMRLYNKLSCMKNPVFYQIPHIERSINKYLKNILVEGQSTPYEGLNYLEDDNGCDAGTYMYDGKRLIAYIPGEELIVQHPNKDIYIHNDTTISLTSPGCGDIKKFRNGVLIDEYRADARFEDFINRKYQIE